MVTFLLYIVKSTCCLTLFYLGYKALLSNETFFRFNRMVLLAGMLVCMLLPFVELRTESPGVLQMPLLQLEEMIQEGVGETVSQHSCLLYTSWSSSDPTIASVTADGNKVTVKGLKVGTATITAKIGDVTATCEVTVDFATGLEEALANTEVFGRKGNIYVNPIQSLQVTVVNMIGKIVYNARISSYARIPVTKGIYIVKLTNVGNTKVIKVNVY